MSAIDIQKFGKYEIIEELGRGGMGVVYKARDPLIGRLVALKTLTADSAADPDLLKRFDREAQAAGRLQHPNIVTIYDIGNANGTPFIAMEFLEGESLEKIIARREPMPLARKLDILLQFCRGLSYAHQRNVVHRDIKPANIFIKSDGVVKIVDFGVVHISDISMTQTGMVIGTLHYMSPEQIGGQHIDQRSDIFSVGIVAYEFVAGTRPFDAPNTPAIMFKIVQGTAAPLSQLVPDVPPVLEQAIMRCLEQQPDNRFQSLDDLIVELEPLEQALKRQMIGELVGRSQALFEQKEYTKAREVLRDVLLLDSGQTQAKSLLAKIVTEQRRQEVASRVERLVGEGNALLSQGKNAEAGRAFEEAVKLDSGHTHARVLLEEARTRVERERAVSEQIAAIQAALGKGQITSAETALSRLREVDAAHHEAAVFEERIRQARAHERRLRLQQALRFPQHLLDLERWEEAVQQLEGLRQEFSGEAEIEDLLRAARQKLAEQQRRRELEAELADVRTLIAEQNFQTAVERLAKLRERSSQDPEIAELYKSAQQQFEAGVREQRLSRELAGIQDLIRGESYQEAVQKAEGAVKRFPDSNALASLLDKARKAQTEKAARLERENADRRVTQEMDTIEKLLAVKDYTTAFERAVGLAKQYPERPEVGRLLDRIRTARLSVQQKQVAAYCQAIQTSLDSGEAQRACEEAEHALRYFPGNSDITALLTAARQALSEQMSRRQPLPSTASFPPASSPPTGEPPSEEDPSATALFQPGAMLPDTETPLAESARRSERQSSAAADAGLGKPAVAAGTPGESAPSEGESVRSGRAFISEQLERLRSQPKLLMAGAGAVLVAAIVTAVAIVHHRRSPRPPVPPSLIQVTINTNPPGATIRIDGQDKGPSPLDNVALAPGKHQLDATKEGYQDLSQPLEVHQGGGRQDFALEAYPLKLQLFTTNIRNAQVQWDRKPAGAITNDKWERDNVEEGQHALAISGLGAPATLNLQAYTGSMPVVRDLDKTTGVNFVTVSSGGKHGLIQFNFTGTDVKLDEQSYDWKQDGIEVPLSAAHHTLVWQENGTPTTKEFDSGPGPQLIVFLSPSGTAQTKRSGKQQQQEQQQPVNPNAKKISDLIAQIQAAWKGRHFVEPTGANVIEYADEILKLDTANDASRGYAIDVRQKSIEYEKELIHQAVNEKRFDEARRMAALLLKLARDDNTVTQLESQIEDAEKRAKPKPPKVLPKAVLTAPATYAGKFGKSRGTLIVISQHLQFKPEPAGGPSLETGASLDIACSEVVEFKGRGRFLRIGQKGFNVKTRSGKTYEFLSDDTTAEDVQVACNNYKK